jgi:uncharacterized protein (DUF1810 family)
MNIYNQLLYIFLHKRIKYINILNNFCKIKFMTRINNYWTEFNEHTNKLINSILDSIPKDENIISIIKQYELNNILINKEESYFIEEFKKGNNDKLQEYMRLSNKFYHYLDAHKNGKNHGDPYLVALDDIKKANKQNHWMWYIFPVQIGKYNGTSEMFNLFALKNDQDVIDYYNHPILGKRLIDITTELYNLNTKKTIVQIMGAIDAKKLKVCMEIFSKASKNKLFDDILKKYY